MKDYGNETIKENTENQDIHLRASERATGRARLLVCLQQVPHRARCGVAAVSQREDPQPHDALQRQLELAALHGGVSVPADVQRCGTGNARIGREPRQQDRGADGTETEENNSEDYVI